MAFLYVRGYQARDNGEWKKTPLGSLWQNFLRPDPCFFHSFCSARVVRCEAVYVPCDVGCFLAVLGVAAGVAELGIDGAVALAACWDALVQATSYCEGAPAALYAFPPVPPFMLPVFGPCAVVLMPGSLNTDPGELAELPGRAEVVVQSWLGGPVPLGFPPPAYAVGAAALVMMMPARQLAAKILCIMITFLSGARLAHPIP
jgi:hypothetical protein